jgi:hypothetical protein
MTLGDISLQPDTANGDESFQAIWKGNHLPAIRLNMLNQTCCRHRFLSQALSCNNCGHLLKQLSYTHAASPQNMCSYFNVHGSVHRKNILIYIQKDATLHSLFYLETALHVSGGTTNHHQERQKLYLQYLLFVTPLLLPATIMAGSSN